MPNITPEERAAWQAATEAREAREDAKRALRESILGQLLLGATWAPKDDEF